MSAEKRSVYDPRKGGDFTLTDGGREVFSSLSRELLVFEFVAETAVDDYFPLLKTCIEKTSTSAFAAVDPWFPGAENLRRKMREAFPNTLECDGSSCSYFGVSELGRVATLFNEAGGSNSGEWVIGGCCALFEKPKPGSVLGRRGIWDFTHLLSDAEKIGSLLYLAEMKQVTFMTKLFDGVDTVVAGFRA